MELYVPLRRLTQFLHHRLLLHREREKLDSLSLRKSREPEEVVDLIIAEYLKALRLQTVRFFHGCQKVDFMRRPNFGSQFMSRFSILTSSSSFWNKYGLNFRQKWPYCAFLGDVQRTPFWGDVQRTPKSSRPTHGPHVGSSHPRRPQRNSLNVSPRYRDTAH